jgi:hypothetical protein
MQIGKKCTQKQGHFRDGQLQVPFLEMKTKVGEDWAVGIIDLKTNDSALDIHVMVNHGEPELGNPINILALMIIQSGEMLIFEDFTQGCKSPGLSFFPQQQIGIAQLKTIPEGGFQLLLWARR